MSVSSRHLTRRDGKRERAGIGAEGKGLVKGKERSLLGAGLKGQSAPRLAPRTHGGRIA